MTAQKINLLDDKYTMLLRQHLYIYIATPISEKRRENGGKQYWWRIALKSYRPFVYNKHSIFCTGLASIINQISKSILYKKIVRNSLFISFVTINGFGNAKSTLSTYTLFCSLTLQFELWNKIPLFVVLHFPLVP